MDNVFIEGVYFLRRSLFFVSFWLFAIPYGLLIILIMMFFQSPSFLYSMYLTGFDFVLFLLKIFYGIGFKVNKPEGFKIIAPIIVASEHQSNFDPMVLCALLRLEHCIAVQKDYVSKMPVLKQFLYFDSIRKNYDRHCLSINPKKIISSMRNLSLSLKSIKNYSILIFPAGTRVIPGSDVTYKTGIYSIYKSLKCPVMPVSLNTGVYLGKGLFDFKKSGNITLEVMDLIPPGLSRNEFMSVLYDSIHGKSKELIYN